MNEPPVMISTKDLSYISDIFEWNFVAGKTANHFKEEAYDDEIKDMLGNIFKMHKNICNSLVKELGGSNE